MPSPPPDRDSFSDCPHFWWPWLFRGVPVRHFVGRPSVSVLLMPSSSLDWDYRRGPQGWRALLIMSHQGHVLSHAHHCWHGPWPPGWGGVHQVPPSKHTPLNPHHKRRFGICHKKQPTLQGWRVELHFLGGCIYINRIVFLSGFNLSWCRKNKTRQPSMSCRVLSIVTLSGLWGSTLFFLCLSISEEQVLSARQGKKWTNELAERSQKSVLF